MFQALAETFDSIINSRWHRTTICSTGEILPL